MAATAMRMSSTNAGDGGGGAAATEWPSDECPSLIFLHFRSSQRRLSTVVSVSRRRSRSCCARPDISEKSFRRLPRTSRSPDVMHSAPSTSTTRVCCQYRIPVMSFVHVYVYMFVHRNQGARHVCVSETKASCCSLHAQSAVSHVHTPHDTHTHTHVCVCVCVHHYHACRDRQIDESLCRFTFSLSLSLSCM